MQISTFVAVRPLRVFLIAQTMLAGLTNRRRNAVVIVTNTMPTTRFAVRLIAPE